MDKYISVKELEDAALDSLPKFVRDYYRSGATEEFTLTETSRAFQRFVPIEAEVRILMITFTELLLLDSYIVLL